jgi:hypothetical protein
MPENTKDGIEIGCLERAVGGVPGVTFEIGGGSPDLGP